MSTIDPAGSVRLNIALDSGLHRQAKARAALEGVALRELVHRALRGHLAQQERPAPTIFAKGGPR